jgi:hypothetical protein
MGQHRQEPDADHDQQEITDDAKEAELFRLRIAKSVADDPVRPIAEREGDHTDKQHCHLARLQTVAGVRTRAPGASVGAALLRVSMAKPAAAL